ncbi:CDP-alcohol phosphatidyltransferase family protein [Sphingorhabdus arenilitoris]|uniref:CDP-alcohol phosphatidyltransferase family protein n=1 Tax=Sphingorhabdus arenilitoris TaxID=1490041 RepID=A0ABV8REK6_9SPHN
MDAPTRIQENLTAKIERRMLNWLCARLPMWVTPDLLTSIGFTGAVMAALGYALSNFAPEWLFLTLIGFSLNWFGDSLDGSIARYRKIERPNYGYFIDHSLDALANGLLIMGMGLSPYMRMDTALAGLAGYLLLSIHTFISAKIFGVMRLTYFGGGPTEVRLILMAMTLAMYFYGTDTAISWPIAQQQFSPFDIFAVGLGSLLAMIFVFHTIKTGRYLFGKGG